LRYLGPVLLALAWRNLWVNRRRTLAALTAVAAGVAVMVVIAALMNGMTDRMLEGATGSFLGHAQIHKAGYRARRTATLTVADADRVLAAVRATDGVRAASGRLFGLGNVSVVRGNDAAVRGHQSPGVAAAVAALVGVEPLAEAAVTDLSAHVIEGRWLERESDVVLGAGVARRTGARVGDAFLVTSADARGQPRDSLAVSGEVPRVVGIIRTGMDDLDGRTALVTRDFLAKLLGLEGQVHEVAIRARDPGRLEALVDAVRTSVAGASASGAGDEVLAWYDVAPGIRILLVVFSASPVFMSFILFLAVAFGILNTMLMANFERTREFGLMKALGARPGRIVSLVLTESAWLALLGIGAGAAVGLAVVGVWSRTGFDLGPLMGGGTGGISLAGVAFDPVLWPRVGVGDLLKAGVPVAVLTLLAGLWPAVKASRIEPVDALRAE
jgi:ABC-type lipoprotein release transport system permease subunit